MNALPLLLVLLAQETGGGAAPLLEKGERLFRQGDTAGALAAFQEAAKADPRDARPQYLTGVALEKKGDAPGATAAYRKAIGLKSDFRRGAQQPRRAVDRARRRGRRRRPSWRRPCGPSRTTPRPQYNLGVARDALGKNGEAVVAYRRRRSPQALRRRLPPEPGRGASRAPAICPGRSPRSRTPPAWPRAIRSPGPTWEWCSRTRRISTARRRRSTRRPSSSPTSRSPGTASAASS